MADIGANRNVESTVAPIVVPASGLWWVQFFVFYVRSSGNRSNSRLD